MQKNIDFNVTPYLKKYWFQLSIICIVLYVLSNKDFSFQFNVNSPDQENTEELQNKAQEKGTKKERELLTAKGSQPQVAKSEASFFSKIPFIGGGSSTSHTKSELPKIEEQVVESYLKRFAHVAINERKKYGVPASIILANALFHSYAGKRELAVAGNNHFAIGCTDWNGERGSYSGKCYRHYENAWTSFRDHSLYLTSGKYAKFRQLGTTDYQSWAKHLEAEGFSEVDDLEDNLIQLIEKYSLDQLDAQ